MEFKGTKKEGANWAININNPYQTLIENVCIIDEPWSDPMVRSDALLISHAPDMLEKHYEEIEVLEDILKNNPIGDMAFKLRMIIESKKDLLARATTI